MIKRLFGIVLAVALVFGVFTLFSMDAHAASSMKASDECKEMIRDMEGFRAIPYWDYSQWTVGYGTKCPDEYLDQYKAEGIPVEDAIALFEKELATFEKAVNKFIDTHGLTLSQHQFDALVSFTYNLGASTLNKKSNTIVQAILGDATENELIYAFSVYCNAGGEFMSGLIRRRMAEANMYLYGVYSEYPPETFCYVRYNANGGVRDAGAQGYDSSLEAVPLSVPTYTGYTFVGWYTAAEGGVKVTSLDETTHGMTLYAHWEKNVTEVDTPTDGIAVTVTGSTVHLRSGPGKSYGIAAKAKAGQVLTILGTTEADGILWGLCSKGWICLDHTNYYELYPVTKEEALFELPEVPVYATVVDPDGITVYNGPHTTYPKVKTLTEGTMILLERAVYFEGKAWGYYEGGWVRLTTSLLLLNEDALVHPFDATTTTSSLAVRSGPDTTYSKLTTLSSGATYTVYAITYTDGTPWGRISKGWICLDYTDFDEAKLEQYQNHIFGDWTVHTASTCVTHGEERRACQYCDHYESREAELGEHSLGDWVVTEESTCVTEGTQQRTCTNCDHTETAAVALADHSFGDWYVTKEATAEENGQERRDCQHCDHYEVRELEFEEHTFGQWYVALEPTCSAEGQERRDCSHCDAYEVRTVDKLDHSYGEWYESLAPTFTEYGEERRDCQHCDSYETRQTDKLSVITITRTYATITCDVLRVRSGPGTSYSQVGKLYEGDVVEIFEITTVGTSQWGRTDTGWICLTDYATLSTVEEEHTEHTYGDWYTGTEPTCTEAGTQCRDCIYCGYTEKSTLDALGHSYGEWYESIAATTTSLGQERRDCENCNHHETREIPMLQVELVTKVYATVTCDSLSVRSGAGSSYTRLGKIYTGVRVEILEQVTKNGVVWGRTFTGWIWLSGYTTLETVTEEVTDETPVTMTVIAESLTIRTGAGTSYSSRGKLYTDAKVQVYEIITVGSTKWARIETGWIMAKYLA